MENPDFQTNSSDDFDAVNYPALTGNYLFNDLKIRQMRARGKTSAVFDLKYTGHKDHLDRKLVCKFTAQHELLHKEIAIIKSAKKISKNYEARGDGPLPKIVSNGTFEMTFV